MAKVFVPLSEEYRSRHEQGSRAIMVEVLGRANLGHRPHDTIADDMATRFGGYTSDFLVAGYRDRNYVIFLPVWVRPETLLNIDLLRLQHCRLKCYSWEPLRDAGRSRLSLKVGIRLLKLPFECWTEQSVSAMVCGFARFLQADEQSLAFENLSGFKCIVAVDAVVDIPEFLSVSMGDFTVTVPIRIEGTAPFGGEDHGIPLAGGGPDEGADQTDPAGRPLARRISFSEEAGGDSDSRDGCRSGESATWNSSELRDRRRDTSGGGAVTSVPGLPPLGPVVLGMTSDAEPPRATAAVSCLGKAPVQSGFDPSGPLEFSAKGVEESFTGGDSGVQRSFPTFKNSEEERFGCDLVTVADLGAAGYCSGVGLEGVVCSILRELKGGLSGLDAVGGVGPKWSGLLPRVDLTSGPQSLAMGEGPGRRRLGGPSLLDFGRGPIAVDKPLEMGWDYLRMWCTASGVCFDRPSGPLWALSWSGPSAGLMLLGRITALPDPTPQPADPQWSRVGGGLSGGPGSDVRGGQELLGAEGAVVEAGVPRDAMADNQGGAPPAWAGDADPTKRGSSSSIRKSSRLASKSGGHAMSRAMSRKAALRGELPRSASGPGGGGILVFGDPASALTSAFSSISELGTKCGVQLSDAEVASLARFLQAEAGTV